jgi:hypothetical protein
MLRYGKTSSETEGLPRFWFKTLGTDGNLIFAVSIASKRLAAITSNLKLSNEKGSGEGQERVFGPAWLGEREGPEPFAEFQSLRVPLRDGVEYSLTHRTWEGMMWSPV